MKSITALIWKFAALAVVMISHNTALAEFRGILQKNVPWTVNVTPASTNGGSAAVTVIFVNSRGKLNVQLFTIDPGPEEITNLYDEADIPRNTRRIFIEWDGPAGGAVVVKVTQGLSTHEVPYMGDGRWAFNVQ